MAEGFDGAGSSAVPLWNRTDSRTPLAGYGADLLRGRAQQGYLERSGATGSNGQHA